MHLYHVTTDTVCRTIARYGLLVSCCETGQSSIYLCDRRRLEWAIIHTSERHGCPIRQTAVFRVEIFAPECLRRIGRGLFRYTVDVPPGHLEWVVRPVVLRRRKRCQ